MKDSTSVTRAILLIPSSGKPDVFKTKYGGETVFSRSLIALSRAGIPAIDVFLTEDHLKAAEKIWRSIRHRLKSEVRIRAYPAGEDLRKLFQSEDEEQRVMMLECNALIHPTLIKQWLNMSSDQPAVPVFRDVWVKNGKVHTTSSLPERYQVMFRHPEHYVKISVSEDAMTELISSSFSKTPTEFRLFLPGTNGDGFFLVPAILCDAGFLKKTPEFWNIPELLLSLNQQNELKTFWTEPAWYLQLNESVNKKDIEDFLWKIAFKEISGEFSKAVNSHLSKPLTFLLARWGFTPNAISLIEITLFLIASSFLFIPGYLPMIVFAVIWQFSAGVLDRCDGEVARLRNYESTTGARFDMLIDDLRFAIPLVVLTYVCWNESGGHWIYPLAFIFIFLWYVPAALIQQYYMRRTGYVSIQALGVDLLKSINNEVPGWFSRYRFLLKGDIRTFYIFLLSFTGVKPILFWVLFLYELFVGLTDIITVQKMKRAMRDKLSKQERV